MPSVSKRILSHIRSLPKATPICAGAWLHLGNRIAVDQALSRLAPVGNPMQICAGVYMRPVQTRFGPCALNADQALDALADLRNSRICGT